MNTAIPSAILQKFTTFGDMLRFLRRRAGVTQMELAIAVGYSDAQISRLEQNLRLPDIPTIEARFLAALDIEDDTKAAARLLELAANVRREDAPQPGLSPYKGLSHFDESDAELFVGREALTAKLAKRVISLATGDAPTRLLAIVGASGSGKSSLVRAGLIPTLRWDAATADWVVYLLTPTVRPLESLAGELCRGRSLHSMAEMLDDLARDPRSLHLLAGQLARDGGASRVLLVVDQFEEVFSLCRSEDERSAFIGNLLGAASEPQGLVMVVITLRADFYAACASYPALRQVLAASQEYIGAMEPEELRRAIEEPARRGHWELEEGFVDLLLRDVGREPGALPLLSHALRETWERRRGHTLTLSGYTASGGVRGAIAETAEAAYTDQFNKEQKAIARRIFLRLTELGEEGTADTRRRATFNELSRGPAETAETLAVANTLAQARLITVGYDSAEVAHEALIREWPRLGAWLQEDRDGLRLHRQLSQATQEWERLGREPDALLRGARLAQAREWVLAHADEINSLEREFIEASIAAAEQEAVEKERQRQSELEAAKNLARAEQARAQEQARSADQLRVRNRIISVVGSVGLILAILAGSFGVQSRTNLQASQANFARAESLRLAAESNVVQAHGGDPQLAALLSIRALQSAYSAQADAALEAALPELYGRQVLTAHTSTIYSVAFSPDGKYALTGSLDGIVRLWDAYHGQAVREFTGHIGGVAAVAFSPDGRFILTGGNDKTLRLWDAATGQQIRLIKGHTDGISAVAFSPDGKMLLSASADKTARLWDAASGWQLQIFKGNTAFVSDAAFSPDGRLVLTSSFDETARLWDAASGSPLRTINSEAHSALTSVAFDPAGKHILAGSSDHTATLWDAATGTSHCTLTGHTGPVNDVAFSRDGTYMLTGSDDKTSRVWGANTCKEVRRYEGLAGGIKSVAFSPDDQLVLTGETDGAAHLWAAPGSKPLRQFQHRQRDTPVYTYSPSGNYVQTMGGVNGVAFSPDGKYVLTGGDDQVARLWDVESAKQIGTFVGHKQGITSVAYSPDGKTVLTGSKDDTVRLWDVSTRKQLFEVHAAIGGVGPVSFSPDGRYFLTSGQSSDRGAPPLDIVTGFWETASGRPANPSDFGPWMTADTLRTVLALPHGGLAVLTWSTQGSQPELGVLHGKTGKKSCSLTWQADYVPNFDRDIYVSAYYPLDSRYVLLNDGIRTARLWDTKSCKLVHEFLDLGSRLTSAAISPDGRIVLTGHDDNKARLWDVATGQEVRELTGHTSWLTSVAFSPDGRHITTGSEDGTARFWDTDYRDTIRFACSLLGRDLTPEERDQYVISGSTPTCP